MGATDKTGHPPSTQAAPLVPLFMHSRTLGAPVNVELTLDEVDESGPAGQQETFLLMGVWLDGVELTQHLLQTAKDTIEAEANNQIRFPRRKSAPAPAAPARRASDVVRPVTLEAPRLDGVTPAQMADMDETSEVAA